MASEEEANAVLRRHGVSELRQSIGGIDPVLDQAENYGRGVRAIQKIVHSQGQVMSSTLQNNAMLWEERKHLKAENLALKGENRSLRTALEQSEQRNSALQKTIEEGGGDRYLALYEQARKTMTLYISDALDEEQLKEKLTAMEDQKRALLADGVELPSLPSREAVDEVIAEQGLGDL